MISLKWIPKPEEISKEHHNIIIQFLWRLYMNNDSIRSEKNLFCLKDNETHKLLDESLAKQFKEETTVVKIYTKAMAEYFMWKSFNIELVWKWKYIKADLKKLEPWFISKYYLYPFFEDKNTVSDNVLYMWFDLIDKIWIQIVNKQKLNMYITKKPMDMYRVEGGLNFSFEYYLDFSRDKLLEKEISLGYTNKIVWDPSRGYWYTHLLRANVWEYMTMPSSAIRLIMWWWKYNTYLTSRKQGKTSFAADRIVAELLSEKRWYWMRKNRRIKFFTDNASKVWKEAMEYIKDFLWEMKDKEIKPWVKYFDINDSNQEVRCNLTWNVFNVISLKWLEWNSDNSTWDWLACDCAIIDEWFRIIERFWKSFKDRAFEECDWILFISTLNEETEITHWWYSELIKWEAGHYQWYNTVRSSDFDNTITYFNNFKMQGKSLNAYYEYTWEKFYERLKESDEPYVLKRMLCWILTDKILFNVAWRLVSDEWRVNDSDFRVIGIDPGWLHDHLWICVFNTKTLIVEECKSFPLTYEQVIPKLQEYKYKYKNSIMVGDLWGPVGNTIFILDKEHIIDYWLKTASNVSWSEWSKKAWYIVLNKWVFVLNWAYCLHNIVKVNITWCQDLIEQFWYMEGKKSTRSNTILYKAKKNKKDDAVFAYLNVMWLLRMVFFLKEPQEIVDFWEESSTIEVMQYDDGDLDYYWIHNWYYY